ncbi:MAG: L,D-transpeptidase family protein [Anaerolineales bacterium]|nr:L,D-transpeptidase family protein [Anaerolineales bacterium]MDW8446695.1 L,D-transpeptidase family protein [Anaerolineales bacterium]
MITLDEELKAARIALRQGQKKQARFHALRAAALDPSSEEPWLILGATSSSQAAIRHLQRALRLNPQNPIAQRGLDWVSSNQAASTPSSIAQTQPIRIGKPSTRVPPKAKKHSVAFWLIFLVFFTCALSMPVLPFPILALVYSSNLGRFSLHLQNWNSTAPASYLSPQESPTPNSAESLSSTLAELPSPTPTPSPSDTPPPPPTSTPTPSPTPEPTATETPTTAPSPTAKANKKKKKKPTPASHQFKHTGPEIASFLPKGVDEDEPWIEVDLSSQRSYAYIGRSLVRSFIVSTGTAQNPTVKGTFRIYVKYRYANMSGPDYFLRNVPYVMYFYKGYGLHGTYWHNNFGVPMSHGCVNYTIADAAWLFEFADVGTVVYIHE